MKYSLISIALASGLLGAQSQVTITGVADKTIYSAPVTLQLTPQAGYSVSALLNDQAIAVGSPEVVSGVDYYDLRLFSTNNTTLAVTSQLVRFVIAAPERLGTETGLPAWTPYPLIPSADAEFAGAELAIMAPAAYPQGMEIPVVAWVRKSGRAVRANGAVSAPGQNPIQLLRGVGSGFLAATNPAGPLTYAASVSGLSQTKTIQVEDNTVWTGVSGLLAGQITWAPDSRIAITNHVNIAPGAQLSIGEGSIVRINPGISITNEGAVVINGTTERPVVFGPLTAGQPWGGFLMWSGLGSVTGTGVIFTGSGANASWFGSSGNPSSHRKEQALFFCNGPSPITLRDSAAIYLAGQLGHAVNGGIYTLERFVMQRATTGGEYSGATQPLRFNVNDSAFIECPLDSPAFVDGDNDALYIIHGTHGFTNTLFGFTKDDGIDCGGNGAGVLYLVDCWFESIFHEGTSLSGNGKIVNHIRNTLLNNGQAIESGYDAPTANVTNCLVVANVTGLRLGDNYTSGYSHNGALNAGSNIVLGNHRNVWGISFVDWAYRSNQMSIASNLLSESDPRWPANEVWSAQEDAALLASYGNFPADSPVGIGFALRTNRVSISELRTGVPLRLSRFSTNLVEVDYELESPVGTLVQGSVQFEPGETVEKLVIAAAGLETYDALSLRLLGPKGAQITGMNQVFILKKAEAVTLIPKGSTWKYLATGQNLGTTWVVPEFPDGGWASGAAQLGFGDGDEVSQVPTNGQITTYFRLGFNVDNPSQFENLTVALLRDDGGVVYLNGTEVFRSNITNGVPLSHLGLATNALAGDETTTFYTNIVATPVLLPGTNVCAVEIHQSSPTSSDLSFDLQLYGNPKQEVRLKSARISTGLLLYWDDESCRLEEAQDPGGPWQLCPTGNPQVVSTSADQRFYRLRK